MKQRFKKLKLKIKNLCIKKTANLRKKKLKSVDFTIISNNCWGGDVYRYFGLPYLSPMAGLYFFADEYIRMLKNLKYYLSLPLHFISVEESKYKDELVRLNQQDKIIGKLGDVEIVFLHYPTQEEAREKWERRAKRINYDNLIVKFSRQNLCTDEHIEIFSQLPYEKKIFFDNMDTTDKYPFSIYYKGQENIGYLRDDISQYRKYVDILEFINK